MADEVGLVEVAPGVRLAPDAPAALWQLVDEGVAALSGKAPTAEASSGGSGPRVRLAGRTRAAGLLAVLALVLLAVIALAGAGDQGALASGGASTPSPAQPSPPADGRLDEEVGTGTPTPGDSAGAVPTQASSSAAAGSSDWWVVLAQLDERRGRALRAADPSLISSYAAPASQVALADAQVIAGLVAEGIAPRGWSTTLIALEEVVPEPGSDPTAGPQPEPLGSQESSGVESSAAPQSSAGPQPSVDGEPAAAQDRAPSPVPEGDVIVGPAVQQVQLVIVDRRSAYTLVDRAGRTVRSVQAAPEQRWAVTLQRASGASDSGAGSPAPEDAAASASRDPGWRLLAVSRTP